MLVEALRETVPIVRHTRGVVYVRRSKVNCSGNASKVCGKLSSFNSHPLVFIRQLIGPCSIIVTQLSCTEDGNNSLVETRDFMFPP